MRIELESKTIYYQEHDELVMLKKELEQLKGGH